MCISNLLTDRTVIQYYISICVCSVTLLCLFCAVLVSAPTKVLVLVLVLVLKKIGSLGLGLGLEKKVLVTSLIDRNWQFLSMSRSLFPN